MYLHHIILFNERQIIQECIPVGCVPSAAVAIGWGYLPRGRGCLPPPCEQNNRRLSKHNLAATTLRTVKIPVTIVKGKGVVPGDSFKKDK